MSDFIRRLRVFVSCPGDVADERKALDAAIDSVNRGMGRDRAVVQSWQWGKDVIPQIGPNPQEVVDGQLPPYDIYLGILSSRFGTPTKGHGSGTEKEFRDALRKWGETGAPWILFYFNDAPPSAKTSEDAMQYVQVLKFREELQTKGIVQGYTGVRDSDDAFYHHVRKHLEGLVEKLTSPAKTRAKPPPDAQTEIPPDYLSWLQKQCADIDLLGLKLEEGQSVQLNQVYVPMVTAAGKEDAVAEPNVTEERDKFRLLLDALNEGSLYVPGAPGSGKSTFCRWVAWLACAGAMPQQVLAWPSIHKDYEETFPNNLLGRLPLLVRLRDFWNELPQTNGRALSAVQLNEALQRWVAANIPDLGPAILEAHLQAGTALLILDGVDEVPLTRDQGGTQSHPRELLLSGLIDAIPRWTKAGNRVLLTSRPYGLDADQRRRIAVPPAPIGELTKPLQARLIRCWFAILKGDRGEDLANELLGEISGRQELNELAANPMLLTAICIIYNQGKRIPQEKFELYDRIVGNVLHNRYQGNAVDRARGRLSVIAHGMHTGAGLDEDRSTPQAQATHGEIERMLKAYQDKRPGTEEALVTVAAARDDLLSESGLLLPRGDNRAGFYHLSFQDFFAARWVEDRSLDDLLGIFRERAPASEWHATLSFLFGSLLARSMTPDRAIEFLTSVIGVLDDSSIALAVVAGECLQILMGRNYRLAPSVEAHYREFCLKAIASDASVEDRWALGLALGRIGDPRIVRDLRKPEGYIVSAKYSTLFPV